MKKRVTIYLTTVMLVFFIGVKSVSAITISDERSYHKFTGYSKCERINDDGQDMGWNYLKLDTTDSGIPIVYVTEVPKMGSPAIHIECASKNELKGKEFVVEVTNTAKILEDERILRDKKDSTDNSDKNNSNSSNSTNSNSDNSTCEGILGDPTNKDEIAWYLSKTLKFVQFCGPLLVIVMTLLELIKAVTSSDKDALSKMLKKTIQRVIYAVLLFVFPSILDWLLKLINIYGTCGI